MAFYKPQETIIKYQDTCCQPGYRLSTELLNALVTISSAISVVNRLSTYSARKT